MVDIETGELIIKPGREKSLFRHHPWVYSGAVADVKGANQPGNTVKVRSRSGSFLGWAAYNPNSQIAARMWSFNQDDRINLAFFRQRLSHAITLRQQIQPGFSPLGARRLVHAESDGLPGLIVDRYANWLVIQFLTAGVDLWREVLVALLADLTGAGGIFERSDVDVRHLEGLEERTGLLFGEPPVADVEILENELRFQVDIKSGHKTGFYLDQRENRSIINQLASGCRVLDCFCYTGGFTISALAGGAESVLAVDSSAEALAQAARHISLNGLNPSRVEFHQGDVFQVLRGLRDRAQSFDLIVLDPPKFAQTASQVQRAARGYKDINLLAFKLLRPGGTLVTFSCSGSVSAELFQKIIAGAALDAGVDARIVRYLSQSPDHPVALNFPEGAYLKGLVVRV